MTKPTRAARRTGRARRSPPRWARRPRRRPRARRRCRARRAPCVGMSRMTDASFMASSIFQARAVEGAPDKAARKPRGSGALGNFGEDAARAHDPPPPVKEPRVPNGTGTTARSLSQTEGRRRQAARAARMRGAGRFFGHETAFWHGIAAKIPLSLLALAETPGRRKEQGGKQGNLCQNAFGGHFDGEIAHGDPARRLPTGFRELGAREGRSGRCRKTATPVRPAPGRTGAPASGLTPNRTPPATRPPCRCAPR